MATIIVIVGAIVSTAIAVIGIVFQTHKKLPVPEQADQTKRGPLTGAGWLLIVLAFLSGVAKSNND